MTLSGKTLFITGASRGIGRAIALRAARDGANVVVVGKTESPHPKLAGTVHDAVQEIQQNGGQAVACVADVRFEDQILSAVETGVRTFGGIDILINNAGMIRRTPAVDYSEDDWTTVVEVNLSSVFRLSQAGGRRMIEQGYGKIVNIASLLSFQGGITVPAYTASKSGVAGLTKALANEWAKLGVNVNAIAPGYMVTNNTTEFERVRALTIENWTLPARRKR